jgi:hypothetical protein
MVEEADGLRGDEPVNECVHTKIDAGTCEAPVATSWTLLHDQPGLVADPTPGLTACV